MQFIMEGPSPARADARKGATLAIAALLALVLSGCADKGDSQGAAAPTAVTTPADAPLQIPPAPVQSRPTKRLLKFVGTLFGNEEVTLSSQVEGQVTALHADLGDQAHADAVGRHIPR